MIDGKAFGAAKAALLRIVRRGGYSPAKTMVCVYVDDRSRLRSYCRRNGGITLMEGIGRLLDSAGVPRSESVARRTGAYGRLIEDLKRESGAKDSDQLSELIRNGSWDEFIRRRIQYT